MSGRNCSSSSGGAEGLVGAMLLGSISAGMDDETSDFDIQLVFTDDAIENHQDYRKPHITLCRKTDCWATSLTELESCERSSPDVRELLHAVFVLDDHGILKQTVENLVHYPPDSLGAIDSAKLDSYYDGVFRSLKCRRHFNGTHRGRRECLRPN